MPPLLWTGAYFVTTLCTVVYIHKCYLGVVFPFCCRQLGEWLGYLDLGEVGLRPPFGWLAGEPFFGL